jgi:hypothetical protein
MRTYETRHRRRSCRARRRSDHGWRGVFIEVEKCELSGEGQISEQVGKWRSS